MTIIYLILLALFFLIAWLAICVRDLEIRINTLERAQIDALERSLKDSEEIAKQISDQVIRRALQ